MKVIIDAVDDRIGNYDSSRDCERCRYLFYGIGPNGEHIDGYNCLLTGQRTYDYDDIHHEYLTLCPFETFKLRLDFYSVFSSEAIKKVDIEYEEFLEAIKVDDKSRRFYIIESDKISKSHTIDNSDLIFAFAPTIYIEERYKIDVTVDKYLLERLLSFYEKGRDTHLLCFIIRDEENHVFKDKYKLYLPCHFDFLNDIGEIVI